MTKKIFYRVTDSLKRKILLKNDRFFLKVTDSIKKAFFLKSD